MGDNQLRNGDARPPFRPWGPAVRLFAVTTVFVFTGSSPHPLAAQERSDVAGRVVDAASGDGVPSAMIRVGQTPAYAISDPEGWFTIGLDPSDARTLVVSAPGFSKRYEPVDPDGGRDIEIRLERDPIQLEGFDVEVRTFRTRLDRRRNQIPWNYVLDRELLAASAHENVWELVSDRHAFHFEGYTDYGCATARIFGEVVTVALFIDQRAVPLGWLEDFRPQDFAMVEVYGFGGAIHAYTQRYLDWMTDHGGIPKPFDMMPGLCPKQKPEPGTMKRGRPVGEH